MAERAKLVDPAASEIAPEAPPAAPQLDVRGFGPKRTPTQPDRPIEAIREASANAGLVSREPSKQPVKKSDRRRRTGRNIQLSAKISERAQGLLDEIYEAHKEPDGNPKWTIGQILEFSLEAFKRELEKSGQAA